ncbi:MAG: segregation and condensation protein segregation and condensation protein [Candidatus Parcubacteria bacterium]|jgi:segregation and condensation protein A
MQPSFAIETERYKGPLEALLDMIESRKLSISEVSLASVTDSYIAYVEALPEMPLAETSQFVLVASTLLLIKSRSLLPLLELTEEEKESVEELEKRLAMYSRIRSASKQLKNIWGKAPYVFPRRAPERIPVFAPAESSIDAIKRAVQKLVSLLPKQEQLAQAIVAPVLKLEEVIVNLKQRLSSTVKTRWSELVRNANRHDSIVHFLAILELVRSGSASVTQERLFSDIVIEAEDIGAPKYG